MPYLTNLLAIWSTLAASVLFRNDVPLALISSWNEGQFREKSLLNTKNFERQEVHILLYVEMKFWALFLFYDTLNSFFKKDVVSSRLF